MKLKIIADGKPYGTHVYDAETGAVLDNVVNINVIMDDQIEGGAPRVTLTMKNVPIKLVAYGFKDRGALGRSSAHNAGKYPHQFLEQNERPTHMKLMIMSNGKPYGTHVYDAETGAELDDVVNINVNMNAQIEAAAPRVTITMMNVPVKLVADGFKFCPSGLSNHLGE